jgi:hypothetical protein
VSIKIDGFLDYDQSILPGSALHAGGMKLSIRPGGFNSNNRLFSRINYLAGLRGVDTWTLAIGASRYAVPDYVRGGCFVNGNQRLASWFDDQCQYSTKIPHQAASRLR